MVESRQIRFSVTGMTCGGCERGVRQALERLAGVKVITVDRTKNEARVTLEGSATPIEQMISAIQGAGRFQAKVG
jgi:copper chaperone CopZ